jgi:hypothetical protein
MLQPENRIADEKRAHFIAAVIEHQRFPVGMITFAAIGMFKQIRTVKKAQTMRVVGKMRRHPIENYANSRWCNLSTRYMKSCGLPKREVGAK